MFQSRWFQLGDSLCSIQPFNIPIDFIGLSLTFCIMRTHTWVWVEIQHKLDVGQEECQQQLFGWTKQSAWGTYQILAGTQENTQLSNRCWCTIQQPTWTSQAKQTDWKLGLFLRQNLSIGLIGRDLPSGRHSRPSCWSRVWDWNTLCRYVLLAYVSVGGNMQCIPRMI